MTRMLAVAFVLGVALLIAVRQEGVGGARNTPQPKGDCYSDTTSYDVPTLCK
jgi:hypothetical protein